MIPAFSAQGWTPEAEALIGEAMRKQLAAPKVETWLPVKAAATKATRRPVATDAELASRARRAEKRRQWQTYVVSLMPDGWHTSTALADHLRRLSIRCERPGDERLPATVGQVGAIMVAAHEAGMVDADRIQTEDRKSWVRIWRRAGSPPEAKPIGALPLPPKRPTLAPAGRKNVSLSKPRGNHA